MLELFRCSEVEGLHKLLDEAVEAGELYNWRRQEDGDYWLDLDAGPNRSL
jgi:hypothetical protein